MWKRETPETPKKRPKHLRNGLIYGLVFAAMIACTRPFEQADAQFLTPTPLPNTTNKVTYAATLRAQANDSLARAQELAQKSGEMYSNGINQNEAAAKAEEDARQAANVQNATAFGEALGRSEENRTQMQLTIKGQYDVIATLTADNRSLSTGLITATNGWQAAQQEANRQGIISAGLQDANTSLLNEQQTRSILGDILWWFGVVVIILVGWALIAWRIRRKTIPVITPTPVERPIEGEVISTQPSNDYSGES